MKSYSSTEEALGPELYRKHLLKVAGVDVDDVMIPPSHLNYLADNEELAIFEKAFGIQDSETKLNPYNDDREVDVGKFLTAAANPDRHLSGQTWGHAVAHSFHLAANLARCKEALKKDDKDGAHKALNAAMTNCLNTHAAICAAAPVE
jgi:hypothetical protein